MDFKFYIIVCQCIVFICSFMGIKVIRGATLGNQYANQTSKALFRVDKLHSSKGPNGFLKVIPYEANVTEMKPENPTIPENLFMLNTDVLFGENSEPKINTIEDTKPGERLDSDWKGTSRESRKINFLRGLWNKPKISPLYLVNGTVCRFVNSTPICTTLTTTGLLPTGGNPSTSGQTDGNTPAVQFPFNNNQQQFVSNNQPTRPLPILDDDSQDIIVESGNVKATDNSTATNSTLSVQQQTNRPMGPSYVIQGSSRPVNFVSNRRPMNRISLRRPMQQFHLAGGRAS